ncbi:MAG: NAD-dependent epimerase/dehydratase family protein [Candidatus Aminicenantia bacterium]
MKVLVVGATGFIGSHVVEECLRRGWDTYTLVRNPSNLKWIEGLNVKVIQGDLFNIPKLPEDISLVFNVSGATKETRKNEFILTNCKGVRSLLEYFSRKNFDLKFFVHVSSIASAGPSSLENPSNEEREPFPLSKYGRSKLCGEQVALSYSDHLKIIILRPPIIYGPRDRDLLPIYSLVKRGLGFYLGKKERYFSLCYVKDLAKIICDVSFLDLPSGEILNVANPEILSWSELIGIISKTLKTKRLFKIRFPVPILYPVAFFSEIINKLGGGRFPFTLDKFREVIAYHWVCDTKKICRLLPSAFQYNFERGMEETIDWYKNQGWL